MAEVPTYVVDAFTDRAFSGNPAAVCLLERPLDDATCLAIAAEMKHSETAFLLPDSGPQAFGLRWFTPKVEIELCGHATLASAAVLFRERRLDGQQLRFTTRSGTLTAEREGDQIRLDFPAAPSHDVSAPQGLLDAVGTPSPLAVRFSTKTRKLLIEIADRAQLRALAPDFHAMTKAPDKLGIKGVIVTCRGEAGFDFHSRYFTPWVGIDEDPVTGAAHTVLAPYWASKTGKSTMRARQDSARGGEMTVRLAGDRVHMVGHAVVLLRGALRL